MYTLRPYQQEAVDRTLNYFRKRRSPAVIVLPTGAGKSLVIAELAKIAPAGDHATIESITLRSQY